MMPCWLGLVGAGLYLHSTRLMYVAVLAGAGGGGAVGGRWRGAGARASALAQGGGGGGGGGGGLGMCDKLLFFSLFFHLKVLHGGEGGLKTA